MVCATGAEVVAAARPRLAGTGAGREVGLGAEEAVSGFLLPNGARPPIGFVVLVVVVVDVEGDSTSYSFSRVYSWSFVGFEMEVSSPPSAVEDVTGAGVVVPLVGIVGFENRLKFSGLPLVVGRDVVVPVAVGVESLLLRRNLFPPPPYLLLGDSVVELVVDTVEEEPPSVYSYSVSVYSDTAGEDNKVGVTVDVCVAVGLIADDDARPLPPGTNLELELAPLRTPPSEDVALIPPGTEVRLLPPPATEEPRGAKVLLLLEKLPPLEPVPPLALDGEIEADDAEAAEFDLSKRDFPPTTGFVKRPFPRDLDAGKAGVGVVVPSAFTLLESPPGFWKRLFAWKPPLLRTEVDGDDDDDASSVLEATITGVEVRFLGVKPEGRLLLANGVMVGATFELPVKERREEDALLPDPNRGRGGTIPNFLVVTSSDEDLSFSVVVVTASSSSSLFWLLLDSVTELSTSTNTVFETRPSSVFVGLMINRDVDSITCAYCPSTKVPRMEDV